jgi:hypothetical protein
MKRRGGGTKGICILYLAKNIFSINTIKIVGYEPINHDFIKNNYFFKKQYIVAAILKKLNK